MAMADVESTYDLHVSEYYFRLATECIRLHSNASFCLSSLSDVVNERSSYAKYLVEKYSSTDIDEHLRIIPTNGGKEVRLKILQTSASSIDDACDVLAEHLGRSMDFADGLSVVLYDYVVHANVTEVVNKLGIYSKDAEAYKAILKHYKAS